MKTKKKFFTIFDIFKPKKSKILYCVVDNLTVVLMTNNYMLAVDETIRRKRTSSNKHKIFLTTTYNTKLWQY